MKSAIQRGTRNRAGHDPRAAAILVLDRVLTGNEASQALVDAILRETKLVPSDKRLCTELVYGYLRTAIRIEWFLNTLLRDPAKLPAEMRLVLGLAAYEIAYLTKIPARASVDCAVSRVRNRFGKGLAGVANGVLRTFARTVKAFHDPASYATIADAQERKAVLHALPVWIVRLWEDAYGEELAATYMAAAFAKAVPAVRINAAKEGAAELRAKLLCEQQGVAVGPWGVGFPEGAPYVARSLEKQGSLSFQSAAVQETMAALEAPTWQSPVWDACAGRGGKTAALLEAGVAVKAATDIATARITALPGELARLGLVSGANQPIVAAADAANPGEALGDTTFATVLADVPCSGLGTLARRPEIRFRRTPESIRSLAETQDAILDAAASRTVPGGRIIYLTCTINPAENEERVRAFLARTPGFSVEKEWATPPDSPWHEFFYSAIMRRSS